MEDLELFPGCIHMGTTVDGNLAHVWPTPDPERWHVSCNRGEGSSTSEPVAAEDIPALLAEWGFLAKTWTRWAAPTR